MTSAITSPAPPYYLLSLYAAVDEAVISSSDEGIAATVEQFMPGTTGPNAGWSVALRELVGPMAPLDEALEGLAGGPQLSIPELSRLVFIVGTLLHIPGAVRENVGRFNDVLMLVGPDGVREVDRAERLRGWLEQDFNGWQDWYKVKGTPVLEGLLDLRVASMPLCNAYLSEYENQECVVIDTLFDDDELTPQKVKDVVDLMNWDTIGGRFFVDMTALKPARTDGWTRVLETTDLTGGVPFPYQLDTNLKYVKIDQGSDAGSLQYELDDYKPFPGDGDGAITIDHGYINIRALRPGDPKPGVRVVTRKVVRIEHFPPVLQKIWICALGYGHSAMEMIFGGAAGNYQGLTKWGDPPPPVAPVVPQGAQKDPDAAAASADTPYPPKTAGALAVTMVSDCLEDVAKDSATLADKWAKGKLKVDDLAQFSGKYGARLASDAWIFMEKLTKLPPPPNTKPSGGSNGGKAP